MLDFTVVSSLFGRVTFLGTTDVTEVNAKETISFSHGSISVYPEEDRNYGDDYTLNKAAVVTLFNIFPRKV